jgi:hypothetical protein
VALLSRALPGLISTGWGVSGGGENRTTAIARLAHRVRSTHDWLCRGGTARKTVSSRVVVVRVQAATQANTKVDGCTAFNCRWVSCRLWFMVGLKNALTGCKTLAQPSARAPREKRLPETALLAAALRAWSRCHPRRLGGEVVRPHGQRLIRPSPPDYGISSAQHRMLIWEQEVRETHANHRYPLRRARCTAGG